MIIQSLLDTDLYKLTMQQVVFHQFPAAEATYRFVCRSANVNFKPLAAEIRAEVDALCDLEFRPDELDYLSSQRYFKPDYIDSLRRFRLNPGHIKIEVEPEFRLTVHGNWFRTILFEVPLMAIVNEVYNRKHFPLTDERRAEGLRRLAAKCAVIKSSDVPLALSEFGTRRRYSREWQNVVIEALMSAGDALVGTSNVHDARLRGLRPIGTMGHEFLQAFQAFAPLPQSQCAALETWLFEFRGDLGIALSDVIGIDAFLRDFDRLLAKAYDGARQDSGDPIAWGHRLIAHYESLGIDPMTKSAVFTDGLTIAKAQEIARAFTGRIKTSFGIGTHLTNDLDFAPPQNVIKLIRMNGWPVAKLSDSPTKSVCDDPLYLQYLRHVFETAQD